MQVWMLLPLSRTESMNFKLEVSVEDILNRYRVD